MDIEPKVQDAKASEVPAGTPDAAGVPSGTPNAAAVDAEELRRQYEERAAKLETDLNKMKSSLQKREAELTKDWQRREAELTTELERARLATMDDDERKQYEAKRAVEHQQRIVEDLNRAKQEAENAQAVLGAMDYFLKQGVPAQALTVNQGYDALWESGMGWISNEMQRLRTAPPPKVEAPRAPEPPEVAVQTGAIPKSGPTWEDLRKRYGDDETVYRLVESGQLPSTIIPS